MTTPRVKRALAGPACDPSQRPITSFFARDDATAAAATGEQLPPRTSRSPDSPVPPPSVQANLLAVGMRVRKSVPEGYKTGKGAGSGSGSGSGRDINTPRRGSSLSSYKSSTGPGDRELLPFCGLNKIGGLGVQSSSCGGSTEGLEGADSEPPSLTSSQETVSSMASSLYVSQQTADRKRYYGDDDDDEDNDSSEDDTPSHNSCAPASTDINAWLTQGHRVLAVPRRRQQQHHPSVPREAAPKLPSSQSQARSVHILDQGNADFDEADFLDASLMDMDMDGM